MTTEKTESKHRFTVSPELLKYFGPPSAADVAREVSRALAEDHDKKVHDALVRMGWTPPGAIPLPGSGRPPHWALQLSKTDEEVVRRCRFYGTPLYDLTRDELIAALWLFTNEFANIRPGARSYDKS